MLSAMCVATCFLSVIGADAEPVNVLALANRLGVELHHLPATGRRSDVLMYASHQLATVAMRWAGAFAGGADCGDVARAILDRDVSSSRALAWRPQPHAPSS
jgi:hypothetical protein